MLLPIPRRTKKMRMNARSTDLLSPENANAKKRVKKNAE